MQSYSSYVNVRLSDFLIEKLNLKNFNMFLIDIFLHDFIIVIKYFFMVEWLGEYENKIDISFSSYVISYLAIVISSLFLIFVKSKRIFNTNPAISLRDD